MRIAKIKDFEYLIDRFNTLFLSDYIYLFGISWVVREYNDHIMSKVPTGAVSSDNIAVAVTNKSDTVRIVS